MAKFLIDVNLPYRFSLWRGNEYQHLFELDERWSDSRIWSYARDNDLVIVSKDADFSDRIAVLHSPPRVVHVCVGNTSLRDLHKILSAAWPWVLENIDAFELIRIYPDRIEALGNSWQ